MSEPAVFPCRVLVVEDDQGLAEVLAEELQRGGNEVERADTLAAALERLRREEFDVALVDLMLPDGSGIDVVRRVAEDDLPTQCVVLTGYATVATALEAMRLGAYDYLTKPTRLEEIEVVVAKAAHKARLLAENAALRVRLQRREEVAGLVTDDPGMRELLATVSLVAASDLPVLVQGESGTGKELVARAVHQKSGRAAQPFVALNCGAVPEHLLESELFGHEKGAFTGAFDRKPGLFEAADRGALFLDEIAEISPAVQVKFLRAIESGRFYRVGGVREVRADVRLIAATNKDLRAEVAAGRFRQDLYYRLDGVTLRLPPLRERPGDVALLAVWFLERTGGGKAFSPRALEKLGRYPWPGNVRELQMVVRRAAVLCPNPVVEPDDLPLETPSNWKADALGRRLTLGELEMEYIQAVLEQNEGHRGKTAKALGIDPKTLYNKLGPEKASTES